MISIVIPCYNENKFLEQILTKVNSIKDLEKEVILIDDGSNSQTKKIIDDCVERKLIDKLITLDKNCGKGFALKEGIQKAEGEIILFQDSDMEYDPDDYKKLIKPILDNKADVVYGSRFTSNEKGQRVLYFTHRLANFLLTSLTNIFTNINFQIWKLDTKFLNLV